MRIVKWDVLLFLLPAVIAVIAAVFLLYADGGRTATVTVDGTVVATVQLDSAPDGEISVDTRYNNKIAVKNGKIGIVEADCKDNVCVNTGFIEKPGQTIVCVPSRLVISIGETQ